MNKPVNVSLTPDMYDYLRRISGLKGVSMRKYFSYLLKRDYTENETKIAQIDKLLNGTSSVPQVQQIPKVPQETIEQEGLRELKEEEAIEELVDREEIVKSETSNVPETPEMSTIRR